MGIGHDRTAMDSLEIEGGLSGPPHHQRHRSLIDMEMESGISGNKLQPRHSSPRHQSHQRHLSVGCMPPSSFEAMTDLEASADMHIFLNAAAAMDGGILQSDLDLDSGMHDDDNGLGSITASQHGKKGNGKKRGCRGRLWWILGVLGWVIAAALLIFVLASKPPGGHQDATCTGTTFIPPTAVIPDDPNYGAKQVGSKATLYALPRDLTVSCSTFPGSMLCPLLAVSSLLSLFCFWQPWYLALES